MPLAPLLYLFAGQALLCHFKQLGVGIQVAGSTQPAAQYADDVEPLVPDFSVVPSLVAGLQAFGEASGQYLNPSKSRLLPLGRQPAVPVPSTVAGLEVVQSAASLGIVFAGRDVEGCDWGARMAKVRSRLQRISRLPASLLLGVRLLPIATRSLPCCMLHSIRALCRLSGLLSSRCGRPRWWMQGWGRMVMRRAGCGGRLASQPIAWWPTLGTAALACCLCSSIFFHDGRVRRCSFCKAPPSPGLRGAGRAEALC